MKRDAQKMFMLDTKADAFGPFAEIEGKQGDIDWLSASCDKSLIIRLCLSGCEL